MIKRTLYFGNPAYLNLRNGQMVLHLPEVDKNESLPRWFKREAERTFPVEDLGVVVLDNKQITITQGLLDCLMRYNVAVVTCDSTHMPTGLLLPLDGHTLQSERFRAQIDSSLPLRKQLWQQTVQAKIANQAAALAQCTDAENGGVTEMGVDDKLTALRSEDPAYVEKSFETIAAYESHGAIVHYEPTADSDVELRPEGLLLLDCGAQYDCGTTDITRTIPLGPVSEEQRLVSLSSSYSAHKM